MLNTEQPLEYVNVGSSWNKPRSCKLIAEHGDHIIVTPIWDQQDAESKPEEGVLITFDREGNWVTSSIPNFASATTLSNVGRRNIKMVFTPEEAALIYILLGPTVGRIGYNLYRKFDTALLEPSYPYKLNLDTVELGPEITDEAERIGKKYADAQS